MCNFYFCIDVGTSLLQPIFLCLRLKTSFMYLIKVRVLEVEYI